MLALLREGLFAEKQVISNFQIIGLLPTKFLSYNRRFINLFSQGLPISFRSRSNCEPFCKSHWDAGVALESTGLQQWPFPIRMFKQEQPSHFPAASSAPSASQEADRCPKWPCWAVLSPSEGMLRIRFPSQGPCNGRSCLLSKRDVLPNVSFFIFPILVWSIRNEKQSEENKIDLFQF